MDAELRRRDVDDVAVVVQPDLLENDDLGAGFTLLIGGHDLRDATELQQYLEQTAVNRVVLDGDALDEIIGDATELTDDFAPVDQLIGDTSR